MKIRIETDENRMEEEVEVVIRCHSLNEETLRIQRALADMTAKNQNFVFYKGNTEYYLPLETILFFETEEKSVCAHTADEVYQVHYRLYELEEILPRNFMRVSKSTILNTEKILSVSRNLTASSVVEFWHTHKQVYVSRYYYKPLKLKLEEKRKLK